MSDPRKITAYCPDCEEATEHVGWEILHGPDEGKHGYFCAACDEDDFDNEIRLPATGPAGPPEEIEPPFKVLDTNPD